MLKLEAKQIESLENEDFDTAKMIKFELEKLRAEALNGERQLSPITHHHENQSDFLSKNFDKESVKFNPEPEEISLHPIQEDRNDINDDISQTNTQNV